MNAVDRLYLTDSDDANRLVAEDPMALLIGFALDQQITVQKAFTGPLLIKERVGSLDAEALAAADLEAVFRERPVVHRFPASMAKKVHTLVAHLIEAHGGRAERVWTDAATTDELRANLDALPGFGPVKKNGLAGILARRYGLEIAAPLVPDTPTLGDVDSPEALATYQGYKREQKAAARAAKA